MGTMRLFLGSLFALATLLANPSTSSAQSWLGNPNAVSATFSHTYSNANKLVYSSDTNLDDIDVNDVVHMVTTVAVDYVTPHDKLSVSVNVPVLTTNYDDGGPNPNPHPLAPWDDGKNHVALQDLGITANYQIFGNFTGAVIGSLGVGIPMSDYEVVGFAAPGRGLMEVNVGLQGTMSFEDWVPGMYGVASYQLSLPEKPDQDPLLEDYSQLRSTVAAVLGYYITDELDVNLTTDAMINHDGVGFDDFSGDPMDPIFVYHDVILKESIYLLGLGVGYAFTDKLGGRIFYNQWISGSNTSNASVGGLAIDWSIM